MNKPLIDIDFEVGVPEVDEAHARIKDAARDFQELMERASDLTAVTKSFCHLRDLIVGHFLLEEPILQAVEASEAGKRHAARHRQNHRLIQDSFTYALDMLAGTKSMADLPSIIALIPQKYLGEMVSVDREMAALYRDLRGQRL